MPPSDSKDERPHHKSHCRVLVESSSLSGSGIPAQQRYGFCESQTFPSGLNAGIIKAALEWLASDGRTQWPDIR